MTVWGTTHLVPPFCFVVEVVAPGLLVLKHRPRHESRKFVNVAVLEGDRIKVVDERASLIADCPALLTSMLGFDSAFQNDALNVQVQLALSMRSHGRGGILLVVPSGRDAWRESIVHPIRYSVQPGFCELAALLRRDDGMPEHEWTEAIHRAIDALAGLTAVDGATVMSDQYELLRVRRQDRTEHRRHIGRGSRRDRAGRRKQPGPYAPRAARRDASSGCRTIRARPARRGGARGVAGRTLHDLRVVTL